jgi:hypothetical protein
MAQFASSSRRHPSERTAAGTCRARPSLPRLPAAQSPATARLSAQVELWAVPGRKRVLVAIRRPCPARAIPFGQSVQRLDDWTIGLDVWSL